MDAFANSQEYDDRFGNLGIEELVGNLFQQLFGRDPDAAGRAFYVGVLESGDRTLQSISLDILNGAQNEDADIVQNRVEISSHYITSLEEDDELGISGSWWAVIQLPASVMAVVPITVAVASP